MGPEVLEVRIAAEIFQQIVLVYAVVDCFLPASPSLRGNRLAASEVLPCHGYDYRSSVPLPPRGLFSGLSLGVVVFFL
jgi:hypothetical protein